MTRKRNSSWRNWAINGCFLAAGLMLGVKMASKSASEQPNEAVVPMPSQLVSTDALPLATAAHDTTDESPTGLDSELSATQVVHAEERGNRTSGDVDEFDDLNGVDELNGLDEPIYDDFAEARAMHASRADALKRESRDDSLANVFAEDSAFVVEGETDERVDRAIRKLSRDRNAPQVDRVVQDEAVQDPSGNSRRLTKDEVRVPKKQLSDERRAQRPTFQNPESRVADRATSREGKSLRNENVERRGHPDPITPPQFQPRRIVQPQPVTAPQFQPRRVVQPQPAAPSHPQPRRMVRPQPVTAPQFQPRRVIPPRSVVQPHRVAHPQPSQRGGLRGSGLAAKPSMKPVSKTIEKIPVGPAEVVRVRPVSKHVHMDEDHSPAREAHGSSRNDEAVTKIENELERLQRALEQLRRNR